MRLVAGKLDRRRLGVPRTSDPPKGKSVRFVYAVGDAPVGGPAQAGRPGLWAVANLPGPEVVRVLAGRLNARVRLVHYQRYPSHRRLGIRSPHAAGAYAFRASSGQEVGDQWVAARPVADGLPILRGGSLGLLLQPEATGDDAAELAADRNASVAALTYWGCPVVSFPVPNAG